MRVIYRDEAISSVVVKAEIATIPSVARNDETALRQASEGQARTVMKKGARGTAIGSLRCCRFCIKKAAG